MALTPTTSLPLGFQAPAFELPDARSGNMMNSIDLMEGGPTLIVFMCNHCPFVVHILDEFVNFAREYTAQGLNIVAISSNDVVNYPQDDVPHMKSLAEEKDFCFPYLYDESQEVARALMTLHAPRILVHSIPKAFAYTGGNSTLLARGMICR